MAKILGFSAYFHDSSACIIVDGEVIAAACEERFTRKKHDSSLPENAIRFCLEVAGCTVEELDAVVFHEKPFTKFERIMDTFLKTAPRGFRPFSRAIDNWLREKFWAEDAFRKVFPYKGDFAYCQHHLSHAAAAAYSSGFERATAVVIDGVGERACTTIGIYEEGNVRLLKEQRFPHSIGLLYSAFTQYCGFKVNSGEYKLMGLAPYGQPLYADLIYEHFVEQSEDGTVVLKLEHFGFLDDLKMIRPGFGQVFGHPARDDSEPMTQFYKDVAASAQKVCEDLVMGVLRHAKEITGSTRLVYGGGVALNCVANAEIRRLTGFEEVHIHSASGDSGCAYGAALWYAARSGELKPAVCREFLGPEFSAEENRAAAECFGIHFSELNEEELLPQIAKHLVNGKVVGWFQGRMEFGPRALGNRSILGNPALADMKEVLNLKIKKREGFRPFAPMVLDHAFGEYFVDEGNDYSRMLYVTQGTEKAKQIPSCIHEDNSARVQCIDRDFNPLMYDLLSEFHRQSGIPVIINTSFNERGEPVVNTPEDAVHCFLNTDMDVLVMGSLVALKEENLNVEFKARSYEMD